MNELKITSPAFTDNGPIPKRHTGYGEDISPAFDIGNLSDRAASLAIVMDDLDIPFIKAFNHWVIWNIPAASAISEGIPHGESVPALGNAVQGVAWGKHRYQGPKPPAFIRKAHRYVFRFFALDAFLNLDADRGKKDLMAAMRNHVLQSGEITGIYKREW